VKVHALSWLHSGGVWLVNLRNSSWGSVALNNINLEINIGSKRDWLSTKWGLGIGISPNLEGWAIEMSVVTLMELGNGIVEALEGLVGTKSENLWETTWFSSGIRDESSILESGLVMDGGPVSSSAVSLASELGDVNSDSRHIVVSGHVLVVLSIESIDIWGGFVLDGRDVADESSDGS